MKDAKNIGEKVGVVGMLPGCVAGVAVLAVVVAENAGNPDDAVVAFCILGSGVGYLTGYGIGALIGTVHGAIVVARNEFTGAETGAPVAGFNISGPSAELAAALKKATLPRSDVTLTRLESARPAKKYSLLARQGYPFVLVLRITESYMSARGENTPGSRVRLAVKGEIVDTATNERKLVRTWIHTGATIAPSGPAENKSTLLESQKKKAWAAISSEIIGDIFP